MIHLVSTGGEPWTHRTWEIRENPQGTLIRRFTTPALFAGYSVWGNQWNKLAYFYNDWRDDLNLLLSIYDVYRTADYIRHGFLQQGFSGFLIDYVDRVRRYVETQKRQGKPHGDYLKYFPEDGIPSFGGLLMLDSGGFSFGSHEKLEALKCQFEATVKRDPSQQNKDILTFANLMLAIDAKEDVEGWSRQSIRSKAHRAQIINLKNQLAMGADFIITLDRVIDDYNYSLTKKKRRAAFSMECAKAALAFKARDPSSFDSLLLAAVHPIGPNLAEARAPGQEKTYKIYLKNAEEYLSELAEAEEEFGVKFDGLAIGSLVPIQNYDFLKPIAEALHDAILSSPFNDRLIHIFGATNNKARFLFPYGFHTVDTTYHVVRARNRFMYDPELHDYVSTGDGKPFSCHCPICAKYSWEQITESRTGVREIATVLQSLHNLHASHLPAIESLGEMRRPGELSPVEYITQPGVEAFIRYVLHNFDPGDKKVLVILPCSAKKPYRTSRTQRRYTQAIRKAAGLAHYSVQVATLSAVFGIVPREMEDAAILQHYDFSLNRSTYTRGFHKEICECLSERLSAFIETFGEQYDAVIFYGRERYKKVAVLARSMTSYPLKVLPSRNQRLLYEGLQELAHTVQSVLRPQLRYR